VTALVIGVAISTLRLWNPGGGRPTHAREAIEEMERRAALHAPPQAAPESRRIWDNPVLWREVRTRAYGRRPIVVKLAYVLVFATLCLGFYLTSRGDAQVGRIDLAKVLVPVVITSLILVNLQAVTSITSERDGRALDLLLVTDITPKEFVFGKIWGVLYNTKEMVLLPIALSLWLLARGYMGFEGWFYVVGGIVILVTFSTTLGLHAAMAYDKTRSAVVNSLGNIVFLFIGILVCIFLILVSGRFESQAASFVVFICAGAVAMYASLAVRNQSTALALMAFLCPSMTWYAMTNFLMPNSDPLIGFLTIVLSYGFAVLAMLVPAISEFDVAVGRTVADAG
jgi:tryptophan-rich sensory protein